MQKRVYLWHEFRINRIHHDTPIGDFLFRVTGNVIAKLLDSHHMKRSPLVILSYGIWHILMFFQPRTIEFR
ncbi:hypothetical protein L596_017886 [Steinernema carpocapsae]|uniref:Uncharacterized protein n=1 Tax=Steinernema carpocapsae TaxID=34508 RepID=A0A4U5N386_STECR|nr:hypothetical protein L596_017886 [Steinernema carpocapsae]